MVTTFGIGLTLFALVAVNASYRNKSINLGKDRSLSHKSRSIKLSPNSVRITGKHRHSRSGTRCDDDLLLPKSPIPSLPVQPRFCTFMNNASQEVIPEIGISTQSKSQQSPNRSPAHRSQSRVNKFEFQQSSNSFAASGAGEHTVAFHTNLEIEEDRYAQFFTYLVIGCVCCGLVFSLIIIFSAVNV